LKISGFIACGEASSRREDYHHQVLRLEDAWRFAMQEV
jgi:hypothetical protein